MDSANRYAITADWHIRSKDLAAASAQIHALIRECVARGVDTVLLAGDVFDAPNIHDGGLPTGELVRAVVDPIHNSGLRWYILRGNHDYAAAGAEDALRVFDALENVTVIREPRWFGLPGLDVFALPWDWAGNTAEDTIQGHAAYLHGPMPPALVNFAQPPTLLLHHMQVLGMVLNSSGQTCEALKFGVTREFLESLPFTKVAGGDFHRRQPFYNGAIRQLNHGEEGNPAGFEIWTPATGESEWIELDAAPRYQTLILSEPADLPRERPANTNLRVTCKGWRPSAAAIGEATAAGIKVEVKPERRERIARGAAIPEGQSLTPLAALDLWLTEQPGIAPDDADKLRAELARLLGGAAPVEAPAAAPVEIESQELQESFA
jgi:hypothetical protein